LYNVSLCFVHVHNGGVTFEISFNVGAELL